MKIYLCIWSLLLSKSTCHYLTNVKSCGNFNYRSRAWRITARNEISSAEDLNSHLRRHEYMDARARGEIKVVALSLLYAAIPVHLVLLTATQSVLRRPLSPAGIIHATVLGAGLWATMGPEVRRLFNYS
jgi:hypothetical protein